MPIMDGKACTKKIRKFEKERGLDPKPIIALLTNPSLQQKMECKNAGKISEFGGQIVPFSNPMTGCTDFTTKPLDYPALVSLLKHYTSL